MSNFKETMGNVRKTGVNICPYFLKYFRERFSNFDDLGKGFWGREAPSPIFIKERKKEMEIS